MFVQENKSGWLCTKMLAVISPHGGSSESEVLCPEQHELMHLLAAEAPVRDSSRTHGPPHPQRWAYDLDLARQCTQAAANSRVST